MKNQNANLNMSGLKTAQHNLKCYEIELNRLLNGYHPNLTGPEWDRRYNYYFDLVESTAARVEELKLYKKLNKYYDLWA